MIRWVRRLKEAEAPEAPLTDGWLRFRSAETDRGILLNRDDIFALHEGQEAGTMLVEFTALADRSPHLVYARFDRFLAKMVDYYDCRSRRSPKKKERPEGRSVIPLLPKKV